MKDSYKFCSICKQPFPRSIEFFTYSKGRPSGACKKCRAKKRVSDYNAKKLKLIPIIQPKIKVKRFNEHLSLKEQFMADRKEYGLQRPRTKEEIRIRNLQLHRHYNNILTDAKVAHTMKKPVWAIEPEILECQRSIIILKRMTGQTHLSKSELNINNQYQKQWMQQSRML